MPHSGLLMCSVAGGVRLLDAETFEVVAEAKTGIKGMYGVASSPDGSTVAAVSADGKLRVWRHCDLVCRQLSSDEHNRSS